MYTRITLIAYVVIATLLTACSSGNPANAYQIGLLNLEGYTPIAKSGDTTSEHMVITSEPAFRERFLPANTNTPDLRKPDFSGQMAVAVINNSRSLQRIILDRATVSGNTLNIYYHIVNASTDAPSAGAHALATVPRSGNVKQARFYNGENEVAKVELMK